MASTAAPSDDPHDRLFKAMMTRLEVMAPHRAALVAIAGAEGPLSLAAHFPRTARSILERPASRRRSPGWRR